MVSRSSGYRAGSACGAGGVGQLTSNGANRSRYTSAAVDARTCALQME